MMALGFCATSRAAAIDKQTFTFDSAGVKIAYDVAGKGQPVILIHGLYSSAAMNWELPGTFSMLAEHYQVIALDLRGHGRSDKPTDDAAYGQPMVDDITRLMDHLQIDKAHIAGYSLGGMIAMKFMIDHPERVISGTLGGMGWVREGSPAAAAFGKMGALGSTPAACSRNMGKLAVTEDQVKSVKVPVEIIVGERDPCLHLYVEPLERIRPDWPVTIIPGAGHISCVTKPEFKTAMLKSIDDHAK
jgi:pimeloyl-ACP methyl ester carboxylesterase